MFNSNIETNKNLFNNIIPPPKNSEHMKIKHKIFY